MVWRCENPFPNLRLSKVVELVKSTYPGAGSRIIDGGVVVEDQDGKALGLGSTHEQAWRSAAMLVEIPAATVSVFDDNEADLGDDDPTVNYPAPIKPANHSQKSQDDSVVIVNPDDINHDEKASEFAETCAAVGIILALIIVSAITMAAIWVSGP